MSATIYRGKVLTKDDLNIFIQDASGNYINPFYISYTIYTVLSNQFNPHDCGEEPILETINLTPLPFGIGKFFAAWNQAHDLEIGKYRIKWNVARFSDSPLVEEVEDFDVVNSIDMMNYSVLNNASGTQLPHKKYGNSQMCAG